MSASVAPSRRLLRVGGMWCTSCARAVEITLARDPRVHEARVSFATGTAVVDLKPGVDDTDALVQKVASLGYAAEPWQGTPGLDSPNARLRTDVSIRLAVATLLGMWVMLFQLVLYFGALTTAEARWIASLAGAFATPVVWVAGWRFHAAGWRTLRAGAPGMDFLISVGSLGAWTVSIVALSRGRTEVWFDTSTMLVALLLAGRLLEARVQARGLQAVRGILELSPARARARRHDGFVTVDVNAIARGDVLVARSGDPIAVDGIVERGAGELDASPLTGESEPVGVGPGDRVHAGTRVLEGEVEIRAETEVGERRIDAIADRVRAALDQRTELQATAQRFAERLVPVVIVLAFGTGGVTLLLSADGNEAAMRAITVLVVTCPCALGLAAPIALAVAVGAAARRGVVFRSADAVERAAGVDHVVFDKTGTLTVGRPQIHGLTTWTHADPERVLFLAASAEWGVAHPLATTIRRAAHVRGIALEPSGEREVIPGRGVLWRRADGDDVRVGSASWVLDGDPERLAPGAIAVREGAAVHGWFYVEAPIRGDARETIQTLQRAGVALHLWSGDIAERVDAVGAVLGIHQTRSQQSPEDKAEHMRSLQSSGARAAFVADGINDAPALARAHLGVAVQGATDAALAVSPVVLQSGGIDRIAQTFELARRTVRVMKQNLGWAMAYNAGALPLAMTGWIAPEVAAIAMVSSSLTVTLNALRLARSPRPVVGGRSPASAGEPLAPVRGPLEA